MATIERFGSKGVFEPAAYAQGIRVKDASTILFLAGQVAYDEKGGVLHPRDFKAQAREALRCIKALVESQGGREEVFAGHTAASTLVEVSALAHPDWLIEIEAIAVL